MTTLFDPSYPQNETNRNKKHLDINRICQSAFEYLSLPVLESYSPRKFGNIACDFPLTISKEILMQYPLNENHFSQFDLIEGMVDGDSMLHCLARWMVSYRRAFYVLRFQEYFELIIRHLDEGGRDLLFKKNTRDEYFYEIEELTFLEKHRLALQVDLACHSRYDEVTLFKCHLMECFTSKSLASSEEASSTFNEFKRRLTDFIAVSHVGAGNFLHWMVREVWRNGSKNELIDNNLKELIKFLEPKSSFDPLENEIFSQLLDERNSDGLTYRELYEKLETQYSPLEHSKNKKKYNINELYEEFSDKTAVRLALGVMPMLSIFHLEGDVTNHRIIAPRSKRFHEKYFCPISEYGRTLELIFSTPLNSLTINLNALFKCLAGKIVNTEANARKTGDKLLHLLVRLKYKSGPLLQSILDNNIKFIEFVCNSYLSDKEKEFFLEAKNIQGLSHRELDALLRNATYPLPQVTVDLKWKMRFKATLKDPELMYNLCLSPSLFEYSTFMRPIELLSFRASKFGKKGTPKEVCFYDNEKADDRLLVVKGDTYLHILVRHMLWNKNPYTRNHLLNFFLLAAQNVGYSDAIGFLFAKNELQNFFWETPGISDFTKKFFLFWIQQIKKTSLHSERLQNSVLFSKRFLELFYSTDFASFSDELKNNITNFLLHAKSLSSLYSGNTILHVLVKKIWEGGKLNELIKNNFFKLLEFLKTYPTTDQSELHLIRDLFYEKNRKGLTYTDLLKKLESTTTQISLSAQEHFLITYYTDKAGDSLNSLPNNFSQQERESFLENIKNTAREHHLLMLEQDHALENQGFAGRIQKFQKKLANQLTKFS